MKEAFSFRIDVVFHFVDWKAPVESMSDPAKYAKNNIIGTNLLNEMLEYEVKNFIFSSSAVYGNPQYIPIDENPPINSIRYLKTRILYKSDNKK